MKLLKKFTLLFACLLPAFLMGQVVHKCGTSHETQRQGIERLIQNRAMYKDKAQSRSGATIWVPVRFILVAETDGSGRETRENTLEALCLLNEQYEDQDIQFYLKEFVDFDFSVVYNNPTSPSAYNAILLFLSGKYNAMNVFITKTADDGSGGGTTLAYYLGPPGPNNGGDYIVVGRPHLLKGNVLPHEVGHFFSLAHPFVGWEDDPWGDEPDEIGVNAPATDPFRSSH